LGFTYEHPVADDLRIGLSGDLNYQSRYTVQPEQDPGSFQAPAVMLDAGIRLFPDDEHWEFAVIGKDLTDVWRVVEGATVPVTGGNTGRPNGVRADLNGNVIRGRQVLVRFTYRFGG
jgi:iron complex outermembrane receptor protein